MVIIKLVFTPRKFGQVLVIAVLSLALIGSAVQFSTYILGHSYLLGLVPLFDLGTDSSVPTWYASITLLICSLLLAIISMAKREDNDPFTLHWEALSFIFLYLSIDEVARIHEVIGDTLWKFTGPTHGLLYFTWVIYGLAFILILIPAYINFLRHLPIKTMRLFILAGTIYVGGALGMEMVNARYADLYGFKNLTYQLMTAVEEFLEMSGIAIFIYALMSYVATQSSQMKTVTVQIEEKDFRDET
jgi:hypothetical protein